MMNDQMASFSDEFSLSRIDKYEATSDNNIWSVSSSSSNLYLHFPENNNVLVNAGMTQK